MKKITFILLASTFGISTAFAQPSNDLCANATPIISGISIDFDTTSATQEETQICIISSNGPEVWFTYTETVTGDVTLTTCEGVFPGFDSKISVFSGSCGALVCVFGGDEDMNCTPNFYATVTFWSTIGTTYYIKVHGWNNDTGSGKIIKNGSLLALGESELNGFEYFPNPVNDNLSLKGQSNIQSVVVDNMLGQEIKRMAPNTLETEVNMTALSQGSYFVKVSINDVLQTIRIIKK